MTPAAKSLFSVIKSQCVISSWKGIADYFGCNVRTAKRWEHERGLPVHRAPGKKASTVFAYVPELDGWLKSRENERRLEPAAFTSETGLHLDKATQDFSLSPEIKPISASSPPHGNQAKEYSVSRWRPWALTTASLLISFAFLFGIAENHRSALANIPAQSGSVYLTQHLPAPGAENFFLRGRYFWNLRTPDGLAKAIDAYTQAIVLDPSYADAYAGLAEAYDLLPQFTGANFEESLSKAKAAANRAIALNPNLAAAHAARAFALFYQDWDIAESDAEFRRALTLDPNSALTHQWYASTLEDRLESAECLKQIDKAVRLNPTSAAIAADSALFHANFGDSDAGIRELRDIERTQPTLSTPSYFLREIDFARGDFPAYIADARRYASITRDPDAVALAHSVAQGWAQGGKLGLLKARAKVLTAEFDHGSESGFQLGETLLLLGYPQRALPYFRASLSRRYLLLITMQDCPWAKALSSDPGYATLFAEIRQHLRDGYPAQPTVSPAKLRLPM
jgi:tetratricopeptide (TPR) repeat protein